ncbi:hypothetical protein B0A54_05901 [Lecanosticta acicola]|uniref:SET domain-containing protein n=1 Tax=Lecanosticta acicola TaxID=111012 RepID=A0AAI8Z4B4_9PEZI|nr:hypothetical protein B0A54_05901 [Lecanosticta acicola]
MPKTKHHLEKSITKSSHLDANNTSSNAQRIPENWPSEITFLRDHTYTPNVLSSDLVEKLSRAPSSDHDSWIKLPPTSPALISPNPQIFIETITAPPTHPAMGQRGLFAAQHLPPDTCILLYLGLVHTNSLSDTDPHSDYDLNLDRELGLSVDAATCGNESRCANDYRGIAERPNAEFSDCFVQVPSSKRAEGVRWERRVAISVLSAGKAGLRKAGIKAGEEILVSYGKGFWEGRKTVVSEDG